MHESCGRPASSGTVLLAKGTLRGSTPARLPAQPAAEEGAADVSGASTIRSDAIRSVKWSASSRICMQLLQLGTQIVLARLLTPGDFGLAAIAVLIANFALLVSDLGIGAALIHGDRVSRRRLDTAFWINGLLGLLVAAVIMVLAAPLTDLLQQREAASAVRISGLTCAIAIYAVPLALLERRLELRSAAIIEMLSAFVGSTGGIAFALVGGGVHAIVAVPVLTALSNSILFLAVTRYWPRGFIDRAEARSIVRYVRGLVGFNVINYFTRNTDNALLARFGTAAELGLYTRAFSLMLLPVAQIQSVFGRVLFPAFSRLRDDPERLRRAHRRSLLLAAMVCAPLSVGAAATSPDLVVTVFGSEWAPMAPMLAILSITGVQQVYQGTVGIIYQTTGHTDRMFRWNILFTALTVLAFCIGIRWGAIGICWAVFIRGWALLPLTLMVPMHLIGERLRSIARMLVPLTLCLVLEGVAVFGAHLVLLSEVDAAPARLGIEIVVGAVVYTVAVWAMQPVAARDLARLIRSRRAVA